MTDGFSAELMLRGALFAVLVVLIILAEHVIPRRQPEGHRRLRWTSNFGIGGLNVLMLRFVVPTLGFSLAVAAETNGWGLFHLLEAPFAVNLLCSVVLLDLTIWAQHRLFHRQPLLWRLHRMHHADTVFDVSTAVRFHPLEAALSMLIKSGVILLLGVAPVAFLVFEILLSSTSLFNHGNFRIAPRVDRYLRWLVVTPDMHRVHHSVIETETNSNFGFSLPWWDRLFGTYRDQPVDGHENMTIGLREFRSLEDQRLDRLLMQPFGGG